MKDSMNFLIVGVGGQGTILGSDILAEVGMLAGFDSKKSDIMGLAVRGGSVSSHVRWAKEVGSPMNMTGTVDYMIAFEPMEAMRSTDYMRANSTIVYNKYRLQPMLVSIGQADYPSEDEVDAVLNAHCQKLISYDATEVALSVGNVKTSNIVLLGTLSKLIPQIGEEVWVQAIKNHVPEKLQQLNIEAFYAGRKVI